MWAVIKRFVDLQDNSHVYNVGDEYPRRSHSVTAERYKELSGNKNALGIPVIREIVTEADKNKKPKKADNE